MIPPLPLGTHSFSTIREEGYQYVDKTENIHQMITHGPRAMFLSRPRRFGKSLLCSTVAEIFGGNRKLFGEIAGQPALAINSLSWDWAEHPVIMLGMRGRAKGRNTESMGVAVNAALEFAAFKHGLGLRGKLVEDQFQRLILDMYVKYERKVVVIIDEYDAPLLNSIGRPRSMATTREFLRDLCGVLKMSDEQLRFVFVTGITKFSHVSIFSTLNHLTDITLDEDYAEICGFTQEELEHCFEPQISEILVGTGDQRGAYLDKVRRYYNGYRFTSKPTTVYNPYCTLQHLRDKGEFSEYWYESGTPNYLVKLIKDQRINVANLGDLKMKRAALRACDAEQLDAIGILYHTGYLTISSYDKTTQQFTLDYPNIEVKSAFAMTLIDNHVGVPRESAKSLYDKLPEALLKGDIKAAMEAIIVCLASIEYDITEPIEYYYETVIVLIFRIFGLDCRPEVKTATGRIDTLVETSTYVYCFEFKRRNDADGALAQINNKGYLTPWLGSGKVLFEVGVGIDEKARNIGKWRYRSVGESGVVFGSEMFSGSLGLG